MDEVMIENWNKVVGKHDIVYHLGDFCMGVKNKNTYAYEISQRLNGSISMVPGNHDPKEWWNIPDALPPFTILDHIQELRLYGQEIVLSHYKLETWHHDLRGVWHLFGHSHGGIKQKAEKSCDIGVDCWNFTPISFEQLKEFMSKQPIGNHPGFVGYTPQLSASEIK